MARATWEGSILAESDDGVVVENNYYFPPDSIRWEHLEPAETTSACPWKGTAGYYDVVVGEKRNPDAAWYYKQPKEAAAQIKDHLAFWRGVTVER